MAWTAPRTWVAGETVTAALMNTHVRDNLKAIGDPWTAYTPTLTGITIGNGTSVGRSMLVGKFTAFSWVLTLGSTTTLGAGSNSFTVPTPTTAIRYRFSGESFDSGINNYPIQGRIVPTISTSTVELVYRPTASLADSLVTSAVPYAIGVGDIITFSGMYEAA